jgi:3-dehydroquinate synthase
VGRLFELHYPRAVAITRVRIARGSLRSLGAWTRATTGADRVAVISDSRVAPLYAREAMASLRRARISAALVVVPAGEAAKQPARLVRLWQELSRLGIGRRDAIVALGGGVVGDLAGYAAATWLRGVPWVNVPTTVVGQADSSIGGKTGIDLAAGKNLVGAFHHPSGVLVDPETLATLSERDYRAGLAEVAKTGFATDRELFERIERDAGRIAAREPKAIERAVTETLAAKGRIVRTDEREREGGRRSALNFGHTLGHGLEAALEYRGLRHGEAVAIGMRFAAQLSVLEAGLPADDADRLDQMLDAWRLPRHIPGVPITRIVRHMQSDKKRYRGVRWVLTPRVGRASVPRLISDRRIRAALLHFGARRG